MKSADYAAKELQAAELINRGKLQEAEIICKQLIAENEQNHISYCNLAAIFGIQGKLDTCIKLLRKALEIKPDFPECYYNLGNALKDQGKLSAAITTYNTALKLKPNYPDAQLNLGIVFKEQGEINAAINCFNKALQLKPNYPEAHNNLGNTFREQGDLEAAIASYNIALKLDPKDAETHHHLGIALKEQGDLEGALANHEKALAINPNNSKAFSGIGRIQASQGNLEMSKHSFRRAIELDPNNTAAIYDLSLDICSIEDSEELAKKIDEANRAELDNREESMLEFALANLHHKSKDYTRAGHHLRNANKLKQSFHPSDINNHLLQTEKIAELAANTCEGQPSDGAGRIFIVGAPRCGSTLLESVLSTNIRIRDLGESHALSKAFRRINDNINANNPTESLSKAYAEKAGESLQEFTHSVDKNLYNFRFTEAITRAMPAAKIIDCRRNPQDHILSMLRSNLKCGNNYTSDPIDAAKFLIHKEEAMQTLKRKYKDKIYTFEYEQFASQPEKEFPKLINWLGLKWDELYLHPERSERIILTASVIQARKPINTKSLGGWKNYRDLLEPAEAILRESGIFDR